MSQRSNSAVTELSDDMLREIGRVAVVATRLEYGIAMLRDLLTGPIDRLEIMRTGRIRKKGPSYRSGPPSPTTPPPLPTEIMLTESGRENIRAVKQLATNELGGELDLLTKLLDWLRRAGEALDQRDRLVHSVWLVELENDAEKGIRGLHARSVGPDRNHDPDPDAARSLAESIDRVCAAGVAVATRIGLRLHAASLQAFAGLPDTPPEVAEWLRSSAAEALEGEAHPDLQTEL